MAATETMTSGKVPIPLVSIVAVSRNDDHGGDMRGRMQHFVNCIIDQCQKHKLEAELILVEWNPPPDRPPLRSALTWPANFGPLSVRIVTVPPEVHNEFTHSRELPLFQMIGKNVGIRRARGEYVLATNVDILIGDEIIRYLRKNLKPGIILRADRYDVPADLSRDAPIQQLHRECSRRFFQVCTRYGVFDVRQGRVLGTGRNVGAILLAQYCNLRVFGVAEVAKARARRAQERISNLTAWIASVGVKRRTRFRVGAARRWLARALAILASLQTTFSLRTLAKGAAGRSFSYLSELAGWIVKTFFRAVGRVRRLVAFSVRGGKRLMNRWSRSQADRRLERSQRLHTVACGDFTLLAREDWFRLRGYPEWPIFSWHIDSLLMFAASAHDLKEVALGGKYRIYHIDHSIGSGWSAAGETQLFARLEKRGIPYLSNDDVRRFQKVFAEEPDRSVLNGENWGLGNRALPEQEIDPQLMDDGKTSSRRGNLRSSVGSAHEHV